MAASPSLPRFLPWEELRTIVPYTRQHLSRLEKQGRFPKRVQIGPNKIAWRSDEVTAWAEARTAEREAVA